MESDGESKDSIQKVIYSIFSSDRSEPTILWSSVELELNFQSSGLSLALGIFRRLDTSLVFSNVKHM